MPPRIPPESPQILAERLHHFIQEEDWDRADDVFGNLHDLLHPILMGTAKQKMRPDEAEDMVEEALLNLYQEISQKKCPANVTSWSIDVVNKRVADHYRLRRNTQELLQAPVYWEVHASTQESTSGCGSNPFKETIRNEQQQHLNGLLDSLDPEMRAIINAHYYDELPWEAVGEKLGLTIDVAKKKAKKALLSMSKLADKRGLKHDK